MGRRRNVTERILEVLSSSSRPLTACEIADHVYRDDLDGGPLSATETVWSTIRNLKAKGHQIVSKAGKEGGYTYLGRAM